MSEEREAFEKWWEEACTNPEFGGRGEWMAWQAAQSSQAERVKKLEAALQNIANGPQPNYITKKIHDVDWRIFGKYSVVCANEALNQKSGV